VTIGCRIAGDDAGANPRSALLGHDPPDAFRRASAASAPSSAPPAGAVRSDSNARWN